MIFHFLGRVVRRWWPLLLLAWGLFLLASWLMAPSWAQVTEDQEFAFLPKDTPSRRAEQVYAKAFPHDTLTSNVVLVLEHSDTGQAALNRHLKIIEDVVEPGLRQIAAAAGGLADELVPSNEPLFADDNTPPPPPPRRSIIARIRTPNAPGAGALLISPDGQALLVVVELTTEFRARSNWALISKIENLAADLQREGKVPHDVTISMTGSAVIGRDNTLAEVRSGRNTELLTVLLVIGLLILIYRAPLLAIIPLATVFLAVQLARNLLAILADSGRITVFPGLEIYITILTYGAGVDYCLFLTARYKEELDRGTEAGEALAGTVGKVSAALAASAGTVICGVGMMFFARFCKFHDAGIAIPLGLFLVLCASLTFSPSLLRLAGRWAFWPRHPETAADGHALAGQTGPLRWFLHAGGLDWAWEKMGELLLRRAGTVWLITFTLMVPFAIVAAIFYNCLSYDLIRNLPVDSPGVVGTKVLQQHFPAGVMGPVTVLLVNPHVNFAASEGREVVEQLTNQLRKDGQELGLADVRSLTAPLGITKAASRGFSGFHVPKEALAEALRNAALQNYVADLGERTNICTRLDLILEQNPFARDSIRDLDQIEQAIQTALPAGVRQSTQLYLVGATASMRDLENVVRGDRTRIEILVVVSVFLILILLLREFLVPLYLLLSVLFSYYTTLGVAFVVFWLADPEGFAGIDWKVGIFLFTILIAVGEDYNIFLLTRIREEQVRRGPIRGITEALARTGPIISSCGIIMAGTFASLLAGSLSEMKQLGFALAFGVLLDTFVVRPMLVPAFLLLLRSGRLPLAGRAAKELRGWTPTASSQRTISSSGRPTGTTPGIP